MSLGTSRTTLTDWLDLFTDETVWRAPHRLTMDHPAIDALGLADITIPLDARPGMAPVRIAIPSFATMWGRVCGWAAPDTAGFVFGVNRDAQTRKPIPNAEVSARWL